jgi:hypothetical protein
MPLIGPVPEGVKGCLPEMRCALFGAAVQASKQKTNIATHQKMHKRLKIKSRAEARGSESAGLIDFRGRNKRAAHGDETIISDVMKCLAVLDTSLVMIDVIEYRNKLWLVPEWLDSSDGRWCTPQRMIYVGNLRQCHLRVVGIEATDFALDQTLTKDVLNGSRSTRNAAQYQVIDLPALRVRKPQLH